ncbi:UNVERIFIED_ORG: hypothetical protein ABID33_000240 [Xanthobacter viscosus]|uniref:Uncharacterized protein n=1 Tax=Xanthobacter autotrophicus TaxID=280 RepID=A0A6C1KI42_XANAU|nr:hypothetical protein [Xanthobacter autotrophicus]TLX43865.1 hypothetical protein FBQ73_07130 [Xanthobacter autotrophicus]
MTVPAALQPGSANQIAALLNPNEAAPSWLRSSLAAMTADYPPRLPAHRALSDQQKEVAAEMCSRLASRLGPASTDELAAFVVTLQDNLAERVEDDDTLRRRQEGYLISLDGVPAFALHEAYRRIMQRKVPGFSPRFMPKGPELRQLLDEIAEPARTFRGQLHRLLAAKVEEPSRRDGSRTLPPEVSALFARPEGERVRRRRPLNPSGVDHSAPYHFAVKGE